MSKICTDSFCPWDLIHWLQWSHWSELILSRNVFNAGVTLPLLKERLVKIEAAQNQINDLLLLIWNKISKGLAHQAVLSGCRSKILKELRGPAQCLSLILMVFVRSASNDFVAVYSNHLDRQGFNYSLNTCCHTCLFNILYFTLVTMTVQRWVGTWVLSKAFFKQIIK